MIKFLIYGRPLALKRHRVAKNGRMYDPSFKDKKVMWRQIARHRPQIPFKKNIMLKVVFTMPRPKSHYSTGKFKHLLKSDIPETHGIRPDLDNLVK